MPVNSDPIDLIDGLTSDVDSDDVSKPESRAELKAVLRRFASVDEVRNTDLSGRFAIFVGSYIYIKDTTSTAPAGQGKSQDPQTLTIKGDYAGQAFRIIWACDGVPLAIANTEAGAADVPVIAVYRDSETDAVAWRALNVVSDTINTPQHIVFDMTAPDASSHTYKVCVMFFRRSAGNLWQIGSLSRRSISFDRFS